MDELPLLHQAVTRLNHYQISEEEFKTYVTNCKSINETDANGDTALHLAFKIELNRGVKTLLQAGADPTLRNLQNLTPIELFFSDKSKNFGLSYSVMPLFNAIQEHHPDSESIISLLQLMPFSGIYGEIGMWKKYLTEIVKVYLLPLETLKSLLQWTEQKINKMKNNPTLENWQNGWCSYFEILKEKLVNEIRLVEKAFGLTEIIDKIVTKEPTIRNTILRAMLLGDPPIDNLLNDIANEGLIQILPPDIKSAFDEFSKEYENKRLILEALSAKPDPLSKDEKAFVIPLCEKLQAIAYNFQDPNNNKDWKERVKSYEVRDLANRDLESRYTEYKAKDLEKRQFVFDELNQFKKQISNGTYLGTNGFLAKQKLRDKHADVAENRLSYIYKK